MNWVEFQKAMELVNREVKGQTFRANAQKGSNAPHGGGAEDELKMLKEALTEAIARYENAKKQKFEIDNNIADDDLFVIDEKKKWIASYLPKTKRDKELLEQALKDRENSIAGLTGRYTRYAGYDLKGTQFEFYLDGMLFPVAPSSLEVKIKDKNETINLTQGSELVIPQLPGLSEFTFEVLLPVDQYPWAQYRGGGFQLPRTYLDRLEKIKTGKKPVDFAVIRNYDKSSESDTYMRVVLAEYTIKEDATKTVDDVVVSIKLQQWNDIRSREVRLANNGKVSLVKNRPAGEGKPKVPTAHKVVLGETLSEIARYYYGDSKYWSNLAKDNGLESRPNTLKGVEYLKIRRV